MLCLALAHFDDNFACLRLRHRYLGRFQDVGRTAFSVIYIAAVSFHGIISKAAMVEESAFDRKYAQRIESLLPMHEFL